MCFILDTYGAMLGIGTLHLMTGIVATEVRFLGAARVVHTYIRDSYSHSGGNPIPAFWQTNADI
jgi:hypothetical protein